MSEEPVVENKFTEQEFITKFKEEPGYWTKALPDEYAEDKTIGKYFDGSFIELPKAMINQSKLIGADKIEKPNPNGDWTQERWTEWNVKNIPGFPETPDGYEVELKLPEEYMQLQGEERMNAVMKSFKETAHRNGLSPEQYAHVVKDQMGRAVEAFNAQKQWRENEKKQTAAALKNEFGEHYDDKVSLMNNTLANFFSEEDIKSLNLEYAKPSIVKSIIKMAEQFGEGKIESGAQQTGETRAQLHKEKDALFNHAGYDDVMHPEHKRVHARLDEIFNKLAESKSR